ncbi:MAG: IS630 family transposase [candidate division Zixibacteria bacterium]|nr:IS630 family transposase [candidate division Zixibacteria bacterium]
MFEDETGFTVHPKVGRGWAKKGKRLKIPTTSQHHARLNVFGWVAPLLGRQGMVRTPKGDRRGFLKCLGHLCRTIKRKTIWLYVDNARWHKGPLVERFLTKHPRLHLCYLPPYQPALNMQERVWRRVRYEATTNRYFDHLGAIWHTVKNTTRCWSSSKIRRLCHIT